MTDSGGKLRLFPRTKGITQNEQRELQPSWILSVGRVWFPSPPRTGAERNSERSKMLPMRILPRWGAACCAPTKEWNGAVESECKAAAGKKPLADSAGAATGSESTSWGIWGLWELPTTQETPGSAASSSGARWA